MKELIKNIKKVYKYGKKYRKNLIGVIIATIGSSIIGIIIPLLIAKQIVYLTESLWQQLFWVSFVIFIFHLFNAFSAMFLFRINNQKFIRGTMKNLQMDLGKEILKIKQTDIDKNSSGMFTQRMINDTERMATFISWGSLKDIRIMISNFGSMIAVLTISWQAFLYYLGVTIILTILYLIKTRKFGNKKIEYKDKIEVVSGLTGELIRGVKDIKMLNAEKSFLAKLDENIDEQNQKRYQMSNINMRYSYVIDTLRSIFELGLIILLIYLVKSTGLEISLAIAIINYRRGIMNNVMDSMSSFLEHAKEFNISCDRVFTIIESEVFEKEKFSDKKIEKIKGNFEFKNVNFRYNERKDILKDMSFKINAGEMVGIVGKSGAGKTTIFNLLCKMYQINSGEILIDNININELDKESIRGNITIINQNPYIFNMSIKENLKLVKKDLTDEEMIKACKIACLEEFIETLPQKYDTIVGEAGVILSGGQKQRLAIARAFVQKTKIILFDEATSALDNQTQTQIQTAINNLKDEYTILIIAHRLSTVINCDRILFIDDGKVVSQGKHEELLKNCCKYEKLCRSEIK